MSIKRWRKNQSSCVLPNLWLGSGCTLVWSAPNFSSNAFCWGRLSSQSRHIIATDSRTCALSGAAISPHTDEARDLCFRLHCSFTPHPKTVSVLEALRRRPSQSRVSTRPAKILKVQCLHSAADLQLPCVSPVSLPVHLVHHTIDETQSSSPVVSLGSQATKHLSTGGVKPCRGSRSVFCLRPGADFIRDLFPVSHCWDMVVRCLIAGNSGKSQQVNICPLKRGDQ